MAFQATLSIKQLFSWYTLAGVMYHGKMLSIHTALKHALQEAGQKNCGPTFKSMKFSVAFSVDKDDITTICDNNLKHLFYHDNVHYIHRIPERVNSVTVFLHDVCTIL